MRIVPILAFSSAAIAMAQETGAAYFEKNVRPLLARHCFGCHSVSSNVAMGGLRVDSRESLEKGGSRGPALAAGAPEQSLLVKAVRHADEKLRMPPGAKLKDAEIAILAEWIRAGAVWGETAKAAPAGQGYWAFTPPRESPAPEVKDRAWVKSPIDAFILSALEQKGLRPAKPADKRTLIRRATFDLTGLPPTPEEVRAFLEDNTPGAFARVVDRLLASPRYGERWARHWLDVARYADSNGLDENLVYRNAYRYRDYVIQAFNRDKPYNQFIQEQLAGDLLPPAPTDAVQFERWTATGFLSLGAKMLAEDDPVKMEMDIVDEQLDTTARTFMGLTIGCARCHDHKFDPIPQADYYSMAGIFKSSKTMENFKVVAKWHEYVLAPEAERRKLKAHEDRIEAKQKEINRLTREENEKLAAAERGNTGGYLLAAADLERDESVHLSPSLEEPDAAPRAGMAIVEAGRFVEGNVPRKLEKGKSNVPEKQKGPFFAEYEIAVAKAGAYQIEVLDQEKGAGTADIRVNGVLEKRGADAVENREASPDAGGWSVEAIVTLRAGKNVLRLEHKSRFPYFSKLLAAPSLLPPGMPAPRTPIQTARQYGLNPGFLEQWAAELRRSRGAPNSPYYAWLTFGSGVGLEGWTSPAAALFADFKPAGRAELAARYQDLFRKAIAQWQAANPQGVKPADDDERRKPGEKETPLPDAAYEALRQPLYEKFGPFRAPVDARQYYSAAVRERLAALEKEHKDPEAATPDLPHAMGVTENAAIGDLPIHLRGSHWTLGKVVPRRFLSVIEGENQQPIGPQSSGRLQLAEWLTRPGHPLTSRVMVNRLWRWHFGRGIVPSTDNFGRLGEPPTNQPLLDWLAVRFVSGGWSIKRMHRDIMLSNAYQMSSESDARALEIDPENRLLWRANRRRLEAEAIRDAIMAVSGDLKFAEGGSLLTYKDRQYVATTSKRGAIDYERNIRAVYIPVIRSNMYDVFQAFDLPDPAVPNGDRDSTVVAPQALFMMNGPAALRHTKIMADGLLAKTGIDDAGRIRDAYERALGRPPAPQDIDRALTFIAGVERAIEARKPSPAERRAFAWQSFCKALISSNEFIYLN
jgi:cytochrome c553